MKKTNYGWWTVLLLACLGSYGLGILMTRWGSIDHKMTLQYLTVFVSMPTAIIIMALIVLVLYGPEFRQLLSETDSAKFLGQEYKRRPPDTELIKDQAAETTASLVESKELKSARETIENEQERAAAEARIREDADKLQKNVKQSLDRVLSIENGHPKADEIKALTYAIQDYVDSILPGFNVKQLYAGGHYVDETQRFPRYQEDVANAVRRTFPDMEKKYGKDVFSIAITKAHLNYLTALAPVDWPYTKSDVPTSN